MLNIKPINNSDPHMPMKCPHCGTIFDMHGIKKIACLECTKILDINDMIKVEKTTDNEQEE